MIKFVISKITRFFYRLFSKIIYFLIPIISKVFILLRVNSRILNQLNRLRHEVHLADNHVNLLKKILGDNKLKALDVGAQGGFFNAHIFSSKYNIFFS